MAVRSSISVRQKDGTIKNIYCHWDGYILGGVGEKLLKFYNTEELANKLVDLGGISELGETLEIGEYSETEENPKTTKIFSKGESPCEVWLNLEQARWHNGQEYNYLWEGGEWSVRQYEWNGKVKENSVKDFCEWTPLLKAFEICEKSEKV
ncbi:MAG: hypothetical protein LBC44_03415, partial [Mycoplasmataceae bacterium]|nr:hypothetical protein [Mycoplasmataceae bacterium]